MLSAALEKETEKLLACVHCGLCLPACPTYRQLGNENDSPRGRLYLMRAVAEGKLDVSPTYQKHIDLCLGCRACETVCPSGVRFGHLLETARAEIVEAKPERLGLQARLKRSLIGFVLNQIFTRQRLLALAWTLMRLLQRSGFVTLALEVRLFSFEPQIEFAFALLGQAESQLPAARKLLEDIADCGIKELRIADCGLRIIPLQIRNPQSAIGNRVIRNPQSAIYNSPQSAIRNLQSASARRVAQFMGCVMEGLFAETNRATARVLMANDCEVERPRTQVCCGALHAHSGFRQSAIALAKANIDAFMSGGDQDQTPIIVNAAGCGAMLKEYGELLADDPDYAERARVFSARVRDASEYLAAIGVKKGRPLALRVTYDAPCHLYHGQAVRQQPVELLRSISGIDFVPLAGADQCCGSAGIYNITHADMARRLLAEKIENIKKTKATVLITGNPGCAMHIGAGARLAGEKIIVLHPMELLDLSYQGSGIRNQESDLGL